MKILHLSDTHGCHHRLRDLPEADVVVHSGDFTTNGSEAEAIDFINWLCDLPHAHKIFIAGNHDDRLRQAEIDGLDPNVHYLNNSSVEIEGVKFYGVPMFMADCLTGRQSQYYAQIPPDTDVLITHAPPFGILDFDDNTNYGSEDLLTAISAINPLLHLFGHIHSQHGTATIARTTFSNAALLPTSAPTSNCDPNEVRIPPPFSSLSQSPDHNRHTSVRHTLHPFFYAVKKPATALLSPRQPYA